MSLRAQMRIGASIFVLSAAMPFVQPALAANKIETVTVTGSQMAVTVPAVVETVTAAQIQDSVNLVTSAEALKYLPSIEVRERYIGDRNGIVSTRTTGTVSSAQSLVFADGLMISNLLGNSYGFPPRWGLVSPVEIERADVIYGPFSALYAGNSMGGVINIATRMPENFEVHASVTGGLEGFKLYGTDQRNANADANLAIGDRIGRLSFWIDYDHLDAHGHPMSFSTANLSSKPAAATATPVTGAYQDVDQNGRARLIFGAYSIDHTIQDRGKVKIAYDITPSIRAVYTLALWGDRSATSVQSYLTGTASGQPFYNGAVDIGGKAYTVSGLKPGTTDELHLLNALSLHGNPGDTLEWRASASIYSYLVERSRSSSNYGLSPSGTDERQDGTGWETGDLGAVWRPAWPWAGDHEISFGYHIDAYKLRQMTYNTAEWQHGADGALDSASRGNTMTQALYVQDAWGFAPRWTLTLGGRQEFWRATDGSHTNMSTTPSMAAYPNKDRASFSPKAALAFDVADGLQTRLSFGRAVRYPTVTELYQQVKSGTTLIQNNPDLKPEDVLAYDWTTEYSAKEGRIRLSLFQEDLRDALFSQTDTTVSPNLTQIENVDSVRIRGIETAFEAIDAMFPGLNLSGSVTYAQSAILSDIHAPAAVGRNWPRIPKWRARLVAVYHQNDRLTYSLGYRYSSGAYSTLLNADVNHDTYGGISPYNVVDAKVSYKLDSRITASIGVDNLADSKYFVSPHPYPQRTAFISLRYDD